MKEEFNKETIEKYPVIHLRSWLSGSDSSLKGLTDLKKWANESDQSIDELLDLQRRLGEESPNLKAPEIYRLEIRNERPNEDFLLPSEDILAQFSNLLTLYCYNLKHIPVYLFKLPNLRWLHFEHCEIGAIPPEIGFMQNIESLKFEHCSIFLEKKTKTRSFWDSLSGKNKFPIYEPEPSLLHICNLSALKELTFINTPIFEFPDEINNLAQLTFLHLEINDLLGLPQNLQYLPELKTIHLLGIQSQVTYGTSTDPNMLKVLGNCNPLEEIYLKQIGLENKVPIDISFVKSLKNLRVFDVEETLLKNIQDLGEVSSLERIKLSQCNREMGLIIPDQWANLINLKELVLPFNRGNLFSKIGKHLHQWYSLETLDISYCELQSLPDELGELKNLKYLSIAGNPITELPFTLDNLTNLSKLNIMGCEIHPKYLNRLRELMPNLQIVSN
jgi:Leucine-rich repeat (LRR) protein